MQRTPDGASQTDALRRMSIAAVVWRQAPAGQRIQSHNNSTNEMRPPLWAYSVEVQGRVSINAGTLSDATVFFDAFAGSTKVDGDSRTAKESGIGYLDFHFPIGDSSLPGGVDRIRVQVCSTDINGNPTACSTQFNMWRDH